MSSSGQYEIKRLDPTRDAEWDERVLSHPGHSVFHSAGWAKVLIDTYGFTPVYLLASNQGSLPGLLPLVEARSPLTGARGVSLPFTDECAPLTFDQGDPAEFIKAALAEGRARRWKYWEGRGGLGLMEANRASLGFYGHRLKLSGDVDQLFGRCESSVRRAIRKAERLGVTVEVSSSEAALRSFFALHCGTRKKHGLPPQPYGFFENIRRHLLEKNKGFIATASHEAKPIASAVFLHFGTRAVYKFGASDERYQELRGMNFAMWKAIEWLARHQFAELTFGRTSSDNEGLRRFKLGWGTEEYPITYLRYDFRQDCYVGGSDRASGWHNRIFRLMPLPLLRWTGRLLYPHLV